MTVCTCTHCDRILTEDELTAKAGKGTSRMLLYRCPVCRTVVSVVGRQLPEQEEDE